MYTLEYTLLSQITPPTLPRLSVHMHTRVYTSFLSYYSTSVLLSPPQHPSRWTFSIHNEPTYIVTFLFFQQVIQIIEDVLELCNE